MFFVGAFKRPSKRRRTNRDNPRKKSGNGKKKNKRREDGPPFETTRSTVHPVYRPLIRELQNHLSWIHTPHETPRENKEKLTYEYYLKHSSPRASVKCRCGPLGAGFDIVIFFLDKCRFGCVSAGFALLPWAICRNVLEDFCCINFGGFSRGFSWRIFLGTFSHKNEEKKSGEKIREKIRRLKNKNPRKIHSAEAGPKLS